MITAWLNNSCQLQVGKNQILALSPRFSSINRKFTHFLIIYGGIHSRNTKIVHRRIWLRILIAVKLKTDLDSIISINVLHSLKILLTEKWGRKPIVKGRFEKVLEECPHLNYCFDEKSLLISKGEGKGWIIAACFMTSLFHSRFSLPCFTWLTSIFIAIFH